MHHLVGSPLAKDDKTYISKIECSPVLGGFAIVLSDGRGGFLSSSSADSKPEVLSHGLLYSGVHG